MKKIISLTLALLSGTAVAADLPILPTHQSHTPFKPFISSESNQYSFDSWTIDSGYSYSLFDNLDLYVGARLNNGKNNEGGFLSGVSYQVSPRLSVKSTLHSYSDISAPNGKEEGIGAEVSSRVQLTDNIDLHATLDYQEWQQGVEVGLGFRF
ncbi:ribonuclease regulator [Vibrio sp. LaRot3]|uniref:ribonuclease regulator n=1 Tax=Vibrio sp. LaRot3 TaxID=2998829 RepID=UPI0022CE03EB|nr:ribonuclease regulator [Vibrio sp. LaRot3]MDA0148698.1 ribonuclease regulator [Vibrio sp. LaRot3]